MKYNIIFIIAFICVFAPFTTNAGEFVNLVGIPGLDSNGLPNLNAYINALYRLSISIAALLAVIKIVIAGAKYMLTDIVPAKEEAKKDIQGAIIGLLIVIGAIIILNTINTDLTNLDLTIATTTVSQGGNFGDLVAQRIAQLNNAQTGCAATKEAYEECTTINDVSPDLCEALDGVYTPASIPGYALGYGPCVYKELTPTENESVLNCSCNDRRTGYAGDSWNLNILYCYGYDCSAAAASCSSGGNTVTAQNTNTGQVLCTLPTNDRCPANATCTIVPCTTYATWQGSGALTCSGGCSQINGSYVGGSNDSCLVANGTTRSITCTGPNDCNAARLSCYNQNGYPTDLNSSTITCHIPQNLDVEATNTEISECNDNPLTQWDPIAGCVAEGYVPPIM
jgi:hypothetical protein